jgi:hypothetical protein
MRYPSFIIESFTNNTSTHKTDSLVFYSITFKLKYFVKITFKQIKAFRPCWGLTKRYQLVFGFSVLYLKL